MNDPSQPPPIPPLDAAQRIHQKCEQFEDAWSGPTRPQLGAFLTDAQEPERSWLLAELLSLEVELRQGAGEQPAEAEYLQSFPGEGDRHVIATAFRRCADLEREARQSPKIEGYDILAELGRGGMGVVYKARDLRLKRLVALKMILAGGHAVAEHLARFRTEAEMVARLQHPNIVQIFDIGEQDGHPYIAFEFIEGKTLADFAGREPQPPCVAAELLEAMARAMHYAHQQGVVHRDLKPTNVLLSAEFGARSAEQKDSSALRAPNSALCPKITDFGLAKDLAANLDHTATGTILGTPSYMSPEQADGRVHALGPASDLYSLGAILYGLLTGRPPFQGTSAIQTLKMVVNTEPVPPSQLQPHLPRDLETICLKCLHKDPARRYVTAGDLADDLRWFLNGEPILARPVGPVERTWRWCVRNPTLASMAVGLVAVVVSAFTVVVWQLNETTQALAREEQQRKQRVLGQVNTLCDAAPGAVPGILADLEANRDSVLPHLRERFAEEGAQPKRMRLALALLPIEPEKVRDGLVAWMLQARDPDEVLVIRDALRPHAADLTNKLWQQVDERTRPADERFRALVALGSFDPANPRWNAVAPVVVEELLTANALHVGVWVTALHAVRAALFPTLGEVFRGQRLPEQRHVAAMVLADYAADRGDLLAELLMDADEKQFDVIYRPLQAHGEQGLAVLTGEIDKKLPPNLPSADDSREKLAKRQANAAVALLRMNRPARVWPLLEHSPDPRVRSYLIHRLSPLGADARAIVNQLDATRDVTLRRALLLSLGEFGETDFTPDDRKAVLPKVRELYTTASDPGLHAAAEWLLRTWKQEAWLIQRNDEWAKASRERQRPELGGTPVADAPGSPRWSVNTQGQTMVVIPGPVEFVMGTPTTEAGWSGNAPQHKRRIGRTVAMAAKAVTVADYRRFDAGFGIGVIEGHAPTADSPVLGTTWYQAAAYCNWLSKEDGIPEDQWCYEIQGTTTKLREKYLSRTGYRLPTEAEIEYATRAGAVTSRHYGETEELLPKYGWYNKNTHERTSPVGSLKPNDLGLFDVHGNSMTWCQERSQAYPITKGTEVAEDQEDDLVVDSTVSRVLRGGAFGIIVVAVRSSYRDSGVPGTRSFYCGVRPARTLP